MENEELKDGSKTEVDLEKSKELTTRKMIILIAFMISMFVTFMILFGKLPILEMLGDTLDKLEGNVTHNE